MRLLAPGPVAFAVAGITLLLVVGVLLLLLLVALRIVATRSLMGLMILLFSMGVQ